MRTFAEGMDAGRARYRVKKMRRSPLVLVDLGITTCPFQSRTEERHEVERNPPTSTAW